MAKAIHHLVNLAEYVDAHERNRVIAAGRRFGEFVLRTPRTAAGWLPRRVGHDLKPYSLARLPPQIGPDAVGGLRPIDPVADRSGAGLLTVSCMMKLDQLELVDAKEFLQDVCDAFVECGGYFGSTNTDTCDLEESVSFALAFQILLDAASYLGRPHYRTF